MILNLSGFNQFADDLFTNIPNSSIDFLIKFLPHFYNRGYTSIIESTWEENFFLIFFFCGDFVLQRYYFLEEVL